MDLMLAGPVRWILDSLRCWFLLRSFSSFLPSRWSRRLRWLFLSPRLRRFQLIKARLDFVSQLWRISFPGLCEPLNCACMTPQCCSVQWNGFVIIGPKERGSREQSVCLNNQRRKASFLSSAKIAAPFGWTLRYVFFYTKGLTTLMVWAWSSKMDMRTSG